MKKISLLGLLVIFVFIISACSNSQVTGKVIQNENKPVSLKIGSLVQPSNLLMMVAQDKGFFEQEGLNVTLVEFTAGKLALQAFLAGSLDMTASGEVPVTFSSLQGNKFYVVTQLVEKTQNYDKIVALKDKELNTPQEYFGAKKRKLATSFGGGPEFYTYNFLKKYNITNVELISQKPEDMPVALQSRTVDAIAVYEPFASFAEQKLGSNSITFTDDSLYSEMFVLSANKKLVESNPEIVEKVLKALVRSSEFIEKNPEESKTILIKHTKLDKSTINAIWGSFVFNPVLSDALLKYLSDEAKWAKETGKVTNDTKIPNFNEFIYRDALKKVKPESVTI